MEKQLFEYDVSTPGEMKKRENTKSNLLIAIFHWFYLRQFPKMNKDGLRLVKHVLFIFSDVEGILKYLQSQGFLPKVSWQLR